VNNIYGTTCGDRDRSKNERVKHQLEADLPVLLAAFASRIPNCEKVCANKKRESERGSGCAACY